MAHLGNDTDEASAASLSSNFVRVIGPFKAAENGTIVSVNFKLDGQGAGGANMVHRGVLYQDDGTGTDGVLGSGKPNVLIATGAEITVVNAAAAAVQVSNASGSIVANTLYWIGFMSGATTNGSRLYFSTVTNALTFVANTYPTAPSPFGTPGGQASQKLEAFLVYTPTGSFVPKILGYQYA